MRTTSQAPTLVVLSLLAGIAMAQNISPCNTTEIITTHCMGPKDCLYPNPNDCKSYIQCTVNADGQSGTPVVMPCPAGLEWNDVEKWCDWPERSTCPTPKLA
jgi:hypothetical protein